MLILYLTKGSKVLLDNFLVCVWVEATNKDFLYGLLLHSHGLLGVNLSSVKSVFLLFQNLDKKGKKQPENEEWQIVVGLQGCCQVVIFHMGTLTFNMHYSS